VRRRRVESSVIRSVGYDVAASVLEIEFVASRSVYAYYDVPLSVYEELLSADSMGVYFNDFIKDLYACQQVQ
jgi:KTSC domain